MIRNTTEKENYDEVCIHSEKQAFRKKIIHFFGEEMYIQVENNLHRFETNCRKNVHTKSE